MAAWRSAPNPPTGSPQKAPSGQRRPVDCELWTDRSTPARRSSAAASVPSDSHAARCASTTECKRLAWISQSKSRRLNPAAAAAPRVDYAIIRPAAAADIVDRAVPGDPERLGPARVCPPTAGQQCHRWSRIFVGRHRVTGLHLKTDAAWPVSRRFSELGRRLSSRRSKTGSS